MVVLGATVLEAAARMAAVVRAAVMETVAVTATAAATATAAVGIDPVENMTVRDQNWRFDERCPNDRILRLHSIFLIVKRSLRVAPMNGR